jgi:hypothetical protein
MTTENHPHVVYPKDGKGPTVRGGTYKEAFDVWCQLHDPHEPWLIKNVATGRVIDPATPVIDVNE